MLVSRQGPLIFIGFPRVNGDNIYRATQYHDDREESPGAKTISDLPCSSFAVPNSGAIHDGSMAVPDSPPHGMHRVATICPGFLSRTRAVRRPPRPPGHPPLVPGSSLWCALVCAWAGSRGEMRAWDEGITVGTPHTKYGIRRVPWMVLKKEA